MGILFSEIDPPVSISAQEAAERLLTIRIAGWLLFAIVVLGGMWLIIRWKSKQKIKEDQAEKERIEAENAKERIRVTENIGTAMTEVLKQDSGWKAQYFSMKAKYDAIIEERDAAMKHSDHMEKVLETATGANRFTPQVA